MKKSHLLGDVSTCNKETVNIGLLRLLAVPAHKVRLLCLLFSSIIFFQSLDVDAALVEVDLFSSGDTLITQDTDSGLEWLDLTETVGISYNDIIAGEGGYTGLGFQHATGDQISALIITANLTEGSVVPRQPQLDRIA